MTAYMFCSQFPGLVLIVLQATQPRGIPFIVQHFIQHTPGWKKVILSRARFHAERSLLVKPATHLAILYTDHRDRRKSPGVPGAAIVIFASHGDRRIKSPISDGNEIRRHSPSLPVHATFYAHRCKLPVKSTNQVGRIYHMTFQNAP